MASHRSMSKGPSMFAWFKKRQSNEQKKLLYQNDRASEFFTGFFETRKEREQAALMRRFKYQNQKIAFLAEEVKTLSRTDRKALLKINRELRRLDHAVTGSINHFDESYKPSLGWEDYYNNY
jgi:hypothetical protein